MATLPLRFLSSQKTRIDRGEAEVVSYQVNLLLLGLEREKIETVGV